MNRTETMPALDGLISPPPETCAEEQARADFYALIARLMLIPPDVALLDGLATADSLSAENDGNPLDRAWEKLVFAAAVTPADAVRDEFDAMFISVATPIVNPYASLYLAGFLMEKPLASLRSDLAALGLARREGSGELEDHLGALCETMRLLIAGGPGIAPRPVSEQKAFFQKHIAPWYAPCLDHIRSAEGANFYRTVADFVQAFFELEAEAFEMDDA
ncbi:TorD/DmsD family molecular chaperone [Noviherbaspirillum sp.]|uniref:TorD/DmsD family molecular chaperone n=1 Tax=Noviherbaspirillum sp. TaxID=1926288 RepID=UPI002B486F1A|nr:molecular chaperone TorD family protein [Noviherbaspirillum sp.]